MLETDLQSSLSAMPRFRSIVTFIDSDIRLAERLEMATGIARAEDAHLTVMALRYDLGIPPYAFVDAVGPTMAEALESARSEAEARAKHAEETLRTADVKGEVVRCVTLHRDIEREVAEVARFADLAIVGPPYGDAVSGAASAILDGILYECDLPALVVPDDTTSLDNGTVLIGWDGSRQALKAVKGALPLLQRADKVEICTFDPRREAPGDVLSKMLARYDVKVETAALPKPSGPIAAAIAQRAREIGAGLLVMGAYGHSRFRESVIGGVTRATLHDVEMPLLLAH
ncbi:MAG: universal stress protein [Pseudomonadota bacterium]